MEKRMLLLAVMLTVVALCGSAALALDPMGPPSAGLSQGQWGVGVDYSFSDMDLELDGTGAIPNIVHPDVQVSKVYGNIGYGATDYWSVFVRGGLARAETNSIGMAGDIEVGSTELAWGFGTKVTVFEQTPDLVWGGLFQMSFAGESQERVSSPIVTQQSIEINEIQVAVGPTWTPSEGMSLYAGPFYHWVNGRVESMSVHQYDIKTEKLGVYGGARFEITEKASFNAEIQWTGDAAAFAASMLYKCN
jgi:opacity protein-like surface antigen